MTAIACALCIQLAAAAPATPKRPLQEIETDLNNVDQQLNGMAIYSDLVSPRFRTSLAPRVVPLLTQRQTLYVQLLQASPSLKVKVHFLQVKNAAELGYFNKTDVTDLPPAVDKQAADSTAIATGLKDWWDGADNADAQAKVLDTFEGFSKSDPRDDDLAHAYKMMIDSSPATPELNTRLWDLLSKMHTPFAISCNAMPNKVGKPLSVAGETLTGKAFRSDQWKGKVILVDFWATWCPPCREEIPHVAKIYADYHSKGLEIIGVNSDNDRHALAEFLKQHPEMPWPELFASGEGWHPLTKRYGIESIPTMYLIDRKGVLRTMQAREQMETMIPELLDEPAPTASTPTAAANKSS